MSKPKRNHIIGKVYDITKENVNKLIKELDEYHQYADKLEIEANNNYEMYRDARYAYNAKKKEVGELRVDYDHLDERFCACLNSDEANEKRIVKLREALEAYSSEAGTIAFDTLAEDDNLIYNELIDKSVEILKKREVT